MDELINQAKSGNRQAIGDLVRDNYAPVYRFCARRVGQDSAPDATQETFVIMQQAIRKFGGQSHFETWLFGIAHNVCRAISRRRRRDPISLSDWIETPVADESGRTADGVDLRAALAKLSPDHQIVVLMHEIEELTYGEIAAILRIPVGTVKSRLHHAFQDLRRHMVEVKV